MKLEIGPHATRRTPDGESQESWHTLDNTYQATYRCHWGSQRLPIESETYTWVHASHVLEHIPWWKTDDALSEVYRILKPGGRFTVWVPDAVGIMKMYEEDPEQFMHLERDWPCGNVNPEKDPWKFLNARIFWGARPGELGQEQHFHRAMFGHKSLCRVLEKNGFHSTRPLERNLAVDKGHGWMEVGVEGLK